MIGNQRKRRLVLSAAKITLVVIFVIAILLMTTYIPRQ